MSHKVKFTYMDEKELIIYLKDDEVARFMEDIGNSKVYFDEKSGKGMWIPIDRIRYFQVEREDADSLKPIPRRNVSNSGKERGSGSTRKSSVEQVIEASD